MVIPTESLLPPELYGRIIDIIGNEAIAEHIWFSESLTKEVISSLQACSLVCRVFGHFTRPHIFRRAKIVLDDNAKSGSWIEQLTRFTKNRPLLVEYIHNLHLEYKIMQSGRHIQDVQRYAKFIGSLPNIQSLSLVYSGSETDGSQMQLFAIAFNDILQTFSTRRHQIRSLYAKRIPNLPFASIFESKRLEQLTLDRCSWPKLSTPMTHITSLKLRKTGSPISLSLLLYLPNLKVLKFTGCTLQDEEAHNNPNHTLLRPPFALTTFSLNTYPCIVQYRDFMSFVWDYAKADGVEPFSNLETLKINCDANGITSSSLPDLSLMPALKHLYLRIGNVTFARRLHLGRQLTVISNLRSITFKITPDILDMQHGIIVSMLSEIVASLGSENNLRHLVIKTTVPWVSVADPGRASSQVAQPVLDGRGPSRGRGDLFWSNMLAFLCSCLKLPKAQSVSLVLKYEADGYGPQLDGDVDSPVVDVDLEAGYHLKSYVGSRYVDDCMMMRRIRYLYKAFAAHGSGEGARAGGILGSCVARIDRRVPNSKAKRRATIVFGIKLVV